MNEFTSDFFNTVLVRLLSIIRQNGKSKADLVIVPDLLERGKNYIMSWLKDENLAEKFKNDPTMFYYNIAFIAMGGGIAYADAWDKDPAQIKTGIVDTLIASQPNITELALDILQKDEHSYHKMIDEMFSEFLEIMNPYWSKEDPRPFLFQGLLSFFQSGINLRLSK